MTPSAHQSIAGRLLRWAISFALVLFAFGILGWLADRTLVYFAHAGIRRLPALAFLAAAVAVAYAAFTGIIYLGFTARRPFVCHIIGAGITLVWLAFVMAWSTLTESG